MPHDTIHHGGERRPSGPIVPPKLARRLVCCGVAAERDDWRDSLDEAVLVIDDVAEQAAIVIDDSDSARVGLCGGAR
jgi:hypothetical protein